MPTKFRRNPLRVGEVKRTVGDAFNAGKKVANFAVRYTLLTTFVAPSLSPFAWYWEWQFGGFKETKIVGKREGVSIAIPMRYAPDYIPPEAKEGFSEEQKAKLDSLVSIVRGIVSSTGGRASVSITIYGTASPEGVEGKNDTLSQMRADLIADELEKRLDNVPGPIIIFSQGVGEVGNEEVMAYLRFLGYKVETERQLDSIVRLIRSHPSDSSELEEVLAPFRRGELDADAVVVNIKVERSKGTEPSSAPETGPSCSAPRLPKFNVKMPKLSFPSMNFHLPRIKFPEIEGPSCSLRPPSGALPVIFP